MNKLKRNNWIFAIIAMMTIITLAIVFTVFFKGLYYFDISYLKIKEATLLSVEQIKQNYDALIRYQSIFYQGPLILPDFIMSESGIKHFEEVKRIFEIIQIICAIGLVTTIPICIKRFKERDFLFFKWTFILTVAVPAVIGFLASIDFSKAFIIFHQIVFRNNDWIFDERYDPVITILPESFFMHAFIMIVMIVLGLSAVSFILYRYLLKTYDKGNASIC